MHKSILKLLVMATVVVLAASCGSKTYKNINYLQDISADTTMAMKINKGIIIQPQDKISIIVSSRTPELAAMFNLSSAQYRAGAESTVTMNSTGGNLVGYTVDNDGMIDFPVLGKLYVAGMNRWQLADFIKRELNDQNLLKDAVVSVEFMNFKVSIFGEVKSPGTFTINNDRFTILQALSLAGDLTIMGRRDNVEVIREQGKKRSVYFVDLRDANLFESPAYYLQQSDVVYVTPNKVRAGQSTVNENNFRSVNFWMTLSSFIMSTANTALLLIKNSNKD